ncbi:MAG: alcohol dehydrogenase catalytic domain-containing protein [Candidatus Bathyarchaeota archaeon]|nr:alcohol dehydrogenase catalytic domain-containing protein [Candidatus Bathyarchaeota archaeon]
MKAVVKARPEPGVEVREMDIPVAGPGEVLVRVRAASICGSDLGIYDFTSAYSGMELPVVMGHEFSGVVEAIGEGVDAYSVGNRVLSRSIVSCRKCRFCVAGMDNLCEFSSLFGIHQDGGFSEYISVPQGGLYQIPEGLSFEEAALVEPLSNATHFVNDVTPVNLGDLAVVLGIGPIGLFSAQLLRLAGANVLMTGISVDTERFKIAKKLGLEAVNIDEGDPVALVLGRTSRRGADIALVAVGVSSVVHQAIRLVRKRGHITIVGIFPGEIPIPMTEIVRREITLAGAYDARAENFEESIDLIRSGRIKATDLVTHRFSLDEADQAFGIAKSKAGCKVLFTP